MITLGCRVIVNDHTLPVYGCRGYVTDAAVHESIHILIDQPPPGSGRDWVLPSWKLDRIAPHDIVCPKCGTPLVLQAAIAGAQK